MKKREQVKSTQLCECGCSQFTSIIKNTHKNRRGYIKGHPARYIRGHVFSDYKNRKWNYGFTQMKDGRWRVRNRDGGKTLWSHVVYQNYYLNGAEIPKGYIVHHKDRNNQNDDPDNLEILLQKFHGALHMKINNLFSKRVILIKNNVIMEFDSGLAASRGLKLSRNAVNEAIRRKHKVKGWIAIQHENVLAETLPHL